MSSLFEYNERFKRWNFTAGNGRRIGPRPVASSPIDANSRFVSPNGTGNGLTKETPAGWRSYNAQPGETVFMLGGTYELVNDLDPINAQNFRPNGGTVGNPVTYESYPGELATITTRPDTMPPEGQHGSSSFDLLNDYTIARRLEVVAMAGHSMRVLNADNCEVHGLWIHDCSMSGVSNVNSSYTLYQDLVIEDCSDELITGGGNSDALSLTSGTDITVRYCEGARCSDDGFDSWYCPNTVFEYCVSHGHGIGTGNGNGFKTGPGPNGGQGAPANTLCKYCIAFDNRSNGFDCNKGDPAAGNPGSLMSYCASMGNGRGFFGCPDWDTEYSIATDIVSLSGGGSVDNSWDRPGTAAYISTVVGEEGFMVGVAGFSDIGPFPGPTNTSGPGVTLTDARLAALRGQGHTGTTNDMLLQWAKAAGATSDSLNDALLQALGGTTLTDAWFNMLRGKGYTGARSEMELAFWADGGILEPSDPAPVPELPGTMQDLVDFLTGEGWDCHVMLPPQWGIRVDDFDGWVDIMGTELASGLYLDRPDISNPLKADISQWMES